MPTPQQSLPVAELAVQLFRAVHNYRPVVSLPNTGHLLGMQCSSAAPCTMAGPQVPLPTSQQCCHSLGLQCSCAARGLISVSATSQ